MLKGIPDDDHYKVRVAEREKPWDPPLSQEIVLTRSISIETHSPQLRDSTSD